MTDEARARAATLGPRAAELQRAAARLGPVPRFADALRGEYVKVVAEVKRSSPSKGAINAGLIAGAIGLALVVAGLALIGFAATRKGPKRCCGPYRK